MLTTTNYGLKKPEGTDVVDIQNFNDNADAIDQALKKHDSSLSDMVYQTAGGSATAITLTIKGTLVNGYPITFIASANNNGSATTINGKHLYKPSTAISPVLIKDKAYTVWYNSTGDYFFIKASAEGDADVSHVLATKKFSNDNDTGLVGTMPDNGQVIITPGTTNKPINKGFHDGTGYVAGDSDLVSGNIKAGINIFGVNGKSSVVDTSDAIAVAADIINGKTAYVNGNKITGNATIESLGGRKHATGTFSHTSGSSETITLPFAASIIIVTDSANGYTYFWKASVMASGYFIRYQTNQRVSPILTFSISATATTITTNSILDTVSNLTYEIWG